MNLATEHLEKKTHHAASSPHQASRKTAETLLLAIELDDITGNLIVSLTWRSLKSRGIKITSAAIFVIIVTNFERAYRDCQAAISSRPASLACRKSAWDASATS